MREYISDQVATLVVGAGNLTTAFSGNVSSNVVAYGQEAFGVIERAGATMDAALGRMAIANELNLFFTKVQGSTNEIHLQVEESDTSAFTLANIVPIKGQLFCVITSAVFADSTLYRLDPIPVRCKYVRVSARYSGGSATAGAITVHHKLFHNEQLAAGSLAIIGPSGLAADVKKVDRVADEGMAYSAAIAVSAGTWAADIVTFTTVGHAWIAGDIITVSGCGNASYNGVFTILTAAVNTWTAALVGNPGAFTTAGSALQAQSTTRLVDELKSWTANAWSTQGAYVEITSGTGARQYKAITSNGTHWLAFAAMTTAPVTSDSTYNVIELNVNALVCDTELAVKIGSITVNNIDAYKYLVSPPDLAAGESCQGRADVKGNVQVVGPEAHNAAVARAPVRIAGWAYSTAPTAVSDAADVVNLWCGLTGFAVIGGYNEDGTAASTALPIGTDNAVPTDATPDLVKVGGEARAAGSLYTEGDSALLSTDLYGSLRVGGGSGHGVASNANPIILGGFGSASRPTATDANDSTYLWTSLTGAVAVMGLCEDAGGAAGITLAMGIDNAVGTDATPDFALVGGRARASGATYAEADSAVISFDLLGCLRVSGGQPWDAAISASVNPLLMGSYASTILPTGVSADGDLGRLWTDRLGALVMAGYDPTGTATRLLHIAIDDAAMPATPLFLPVGGEYRATPTTYTDGDATVLQTTINGALLTTSGTGGGAPIANVATVAIPGTEIPLAANQAVTAGFAVVVKAKHTNTGVIYVGPNGVTSATGHQLYPGESVDLTVRNLNLVYIDADVGGEGITFIVEGA